MLSRNLYKMKKTPLGDKRKKIIISTILGISLFFIFYGYYSFQKIKPEGGEKTEIKVETGDRPLKKNEIIYVNADRGLSLRKERDTKSEKLTIIPNKTKLEATEELEGWYKVMYNGLEGWISKEFTNKEEPVTELSSDWSTFTGIGYKIKYPLGWKVKDFGALTGNGVTSMVAFSGNDLPESIPAGSEFIAPIIVKVMNTSIDATKKNYSAISGVTSEAITVGTISGTKYTYTSMLSNTQMTSVVLPSGSKTIVLDESGGYAEDLLNMINTMTIGG